MNVTRYACPKPFLIFNSNLKIVMSLEEFKNRIKHKEQFTCNIIDKDTGEKIIYNIKNLTTFCVLKLYIQEPLYKMEKSFRKTKFLMLTNIGIYTVFRQKCQSETYSFEPEAGNFQI